MPCMLVERVFYEHVVVVVTPSLPSRVGGMIDLIKLFCWHLSGHQVQHMKNFTTNYSVVY